ncbi:hypothetical protein B0H10DRAFT_2219397 [Mycena sp. CBHHK59/15]|nr:hypothetical protein B0H10DRAFT_2219397 [Mycena sp. CBHHK59/15]
MDEESSEDFELDPDLLPARNTDSIPERAVMTADPESAAPRESSATPAESSYDPDGDVEDALAIAEPEGKFSVHVEIDGKLISKAKALSAMMRYRGVRSSTDRLRRVAGVLSFNPTMEGSGRVADVPSFNPTMEGSGILSDGALGAPSLRIGNPVALVVSCEDKLFLAVAQINNLTLASSSVLSISLDMLVDSSARVSGQIFRILRATVADDPSEKHDWRWSLKFEATCAIVPGNLIHPMNPAVSILVAGKPTYLFDSATLITAATTIHDQMRPADFMLVPKVKRTDTFPYRNGGQFFDASAQRV